MNASDQWSIVFGCAKTRSSEEPFIGAMKFFRKRPEDNYSNRVARFNNSLSQLNSCANYSPQQKPMSVSKRIENFFGGGSNERIYI